MSNYTTEDERSFTLQGLQAFNADYDAFRFTVTNFSIKESLTLYLSYCKPIGETREDNSTFKYYEIATFSQVGILCLSYLGNGEILPSLWLRAE